METNLSWTPSFAWHAKVILVCLGVCAGMLLIGWQVSKRLPEPYQIKRPSPQATVWKIRSIYEK